MVDKISPDEEIAAKTITQIEKDRLEKVFNYLATSVVVRDNASGKEKQVKKIDWQGISKALTQLGMKMTKAEIELMVWEVDDDLDKMVSKSEFEMMYKRCRFDEKGLEPQKLFNLVQFLMFDKDFKGVVTEEETYELIYVRYQDETKFKDEVENIFGSIPKNEVQERVIRFPQYLEQINKRQLQRRLEEKKKKNTHKRRGQEEEN
eukprot:CAMPEP_0115015300 /NCGR_PEP_ID=MMETSP0216-20121206/26677_1 /TAXON_ID=223996 /ORGANISM="Protocruzia adherens, Strain Boccale" /LENGTH=204 /DNA_ID=CAMNT_0002385375 /DNA_START=37 /DNA_END=651 /DNA_ORIENTATION=+